MAAVGTMSVRPRRLAHGAELNGNEVDFRVWAPECIQVELGIAPSIERRTMNRESDGYWSLRVAGIEAGTRYGFFLNGSVARVPDPASRFQPEGPHGQSEIVDPSRFAWTDVEWKGTSIRGQIIYELHVGTFTSEGTWTAAETRLAALKKLGVSIVEVMPVAEFPGAFGWGYDGVDLYAPSHLYGSPDDFRSFVNRAHELGLGVILDVVYNHFGPDGNYLDRFTPAYSGTHETEWGRGINFDGPNSGPVRDFIVDNAAYWIDEYHLDGLRLDATQSIVDASSEHVMAALVRRARHAAGTRTIVIIGENEPQNADLLRSTPDGGCDLDGLWNDDWHHTARVAMTGRREAYYSDYLGTPQEFLSAAKYGFLYQGQTYSWQNKGRGRSTRGISPESFIAFLENHDQVANTLRGQRTWRENAPSIQRAFAGLLMLGPSTPMLFQGQEWNSSRPFFYFADHQPELALVVEEGRIKFLSQFPSLSDQAAAKLIASPGERATFERCQLDWSERTQPGHAEVLLMYEELAALRRSDAALAQAHQPGFTFDGAVLGPRALVLRYFGAFSHLDRLLVINWGDDGSLTPGPEPLLAAPPQHQWKVLWSSEDARYGGGGYVELHQTDDKCWQLMGHSAHFLGPADRHDKVASLLR